jgi:hypothetical protein
MKFIVSAILFSMTIGVFLSMMIFVDIHGWKKLVGTIIVSIFIGFVIAGMLVWETDTNETKWNNGYCYNCGTEWTLVNVQHVKNDSTHYYYTCDNCKEIIDLTQNFS